MDVRLVSADQNNPPIIAATVKNFPNSNPIVTILVSSSGDLIANDREFQLQFFDYDANGRVTYKGEYRVATAGTGDAGCDVTKFVYFANGRAKSSQRLTGSWANHNDLSWTIS